MKYTYTDKIFFPSLEFDFFRVQSLTKDMQTEQLLCWSGMTDTEHTTTSDSNEVVVVVRRKREIQNLFWKISRFAFADERLCYMWRYFN